MPISKFPSPHYETLIDNNIAAIKHQMKWKLTLPESQKLVYYFVKLIGLAPFIVKDNRFHPPTLPGKLYPIFVVTGYLLFALIMLNPILEELSAAESSGLLITWRTILHLISIPCTFLTQVIFLMRRNKIVYLMNKLCTVSTELETLGIEEDHEKFFKNLIGTIVIANTVFIVIFGMQLLMEPYWNISIMMKICINNWMGVSVLLIFTLMLLSIRRRFALVNETLYNLLTKNGHHKSPRHSRIFVLSREVSEDCNPPGRETLTHSQRVLKIEALHMELCDLLDRTTRLFEFPIFLHSIRFSFVFILVCYELYFTFCNSNQPSDYASFRVFSNVLRMVSVIIPLFFSAYAAATTCEQGYATKAVLFKVWMKFESADLNDEFRMFSNQLLHTRIAVSAFGSIDLGYSLIYKIFSTAVAYLIIMMQLDESFSCSM